jgi:hypothetical protein
LATASLTCEDCRIGKPVEVETGNCCNVSLAIPTTRPSCKNWAAREAAGIGSWFVPMVPAHVCPLELPAQPAPPRASTHSDISA